VRRLGQSRHVEARAPQKTEECLKNNLRITAWPLALVALLLFSTTRAVGSPPPKVDPPKADCAFSNPGYSGWCRQTVPIPSGTTPKQACQAVLSCLNGNACESNYCNAQNIRSGWKLEEAKASTPPR
jgi:hypothetical protein